MTGDRKKGVSIGAAMKQRMGSQEETPVQVHVPDPVPLKTEETDVLESFNTRLPRSLQRRLKVYAAEEGVKIQDVVQRALEEHLGMI
ncbi:hypothetical protein EHF33_19660 (plasmid) [Deinococcus psychrotolerans]|uniref:Uncharacterized protein n=1 Tax=Deinococcus psychrotolerans TaxID=2489213 RepID=A0A3G8YLC4_9DEIO|nr:hypothetical protein [Deinococcus psychrotolerans]AZI45097.1 hypothetical protein EHF33_19660 [Deinococcus psychrotolerans]